MSRDRCSCGKPKYPDADCCRDCWEKGAAYDDGRPSGVPSRRDDPNRCSCGKGKYPDAPCCQDCWDRGSGWPDR